MKNFFKGLWGNMELNMKNRHTLDEIIFSLV